MGGRRNGGGARLHTRPHPRPPSTWRLPESRRRGSDTGGISGPDPPGCSSHHRLPGHLVAGVFEAPSELGTTFLPTASVVLLDSWDGVVPLATAATMLSLAVMAERGAGSGGHAGPAIEIALTLVMALIVMCPTCCPPVCDGV